MSRLDRLILLLESGSTPSVRSTAARQLGAIAGTRVSHPSTNAHGHASSSEVKYESEEAGAEIWRGVEGEWNEVVLLIARVLPHLNSRSFETRQAAASALAHISRAVGIWDPSGTSTSSASASEELETIARPLNSLSLDKFDLAAILRDGTLLLSSSGNEYAFASHLSAEELVQAQKDALSKLGVGVGLGVANDGTTEDDLGIDVRAELAGAATQSSSRLPPPKFKPDPLGASSLFTAPNLVDSFSWAKSPTRSAFVTTPVSPLVKLPLPLPLPPPIAPSLPIPTLVAPAPAETPEVDEDAGLSARERNRLKRRRKSEAKSGSSMSGPSTKVRIIDGPTAAVPRRVSAADAPPSASQPGGSSSSALGVIGETVVIDPGAKARIAGGMIEVETTAKKSLEVIEGEWPWKGTVERLAINLVSSKWETRHGAALGLKSILKLQGSGGGQLAGSTLDHNSQAHRFWTEDLAARLLCVFALDRFGDYVSDQVVAPVRETAAQALATLLPHMASASIISVHRILIEMITQGGAPPSQGLDNALVKSERAKGKQVEGKYYWQVRHSGLLGLKYLVAVKGDLFKPSPVKKEVEDVKMEDASESEIPSSLDLLKGVVDSALLGLRDQDDDVRSAAAATLAPVLDALVSQLPDELHSLIDILWDCLGDSKDDLSSSIGGVMDLLAKLLSYPVVLEHMQSSSIGSSLSHRIPRLFPFFRHTIATVRLAVLNTVVVFLALSSIDMSWIDARLLRLLYQNLIVEERSDIRQTTTLAWKECLKFGTANPAVLFPQFQAHLKTWFTILMSPIGFPLDPALFWSAKVSLSGQAGFVYNVDRAILAQDLSLVSVDAIVRGRVAAASAIGCLLAGWPVDTHDATFGPTLLTHLNSNSAFEQFISATIIEEWSINSSHTLTDRSTLAARLAQQLQAKLQAKPASTYIETNSILSRIKLDCQSLHNALSSLLPKDTALPPIPAPSTFEFADAEALSARFPNLVKRLTKPAQKKSLLPLEVLHSKLERALGYYRVMKENHDRQVFAAIGGAVISLRAIPTKLSPLIKSITASIKLEENVDLQARSAHSIAAFIDICSTLTLKTNPSEKIVGNLCAFLCSDVSKTPLFPKAKTESVGILTLKLKPARGLAAKEVKAPEESSDTIAANIVFRGAQMALSELATRFESNLLTRVPTLWKCMSEAIITIFASGDISIADDLLASSPDDALGQELLDALTVLPIAALRIGVALHPRLAELLPSLALATQSRFTVVRYCVARCFAALCDIIPTEGLKHIVEGVLPFLGDSLNVNNRRGAIEVISHIVDLLDIKILPYVIFLVVPVLGRMSDSDDEVRLVATNTFATLIKLVPLEAGLPDPPGFSVGLLEKRQSERDFLTQLLDGSKVEEYKIPIPITIELRKYQRDGVSWLAFLAKYQLHGLLCDDMGLGKTLQSICILASKHHERAERHRATSSPDSVHLPSLIICPPTLTGHWNQEIRTYATNLRPLLYTGAKAEREKLVSSFSKYDTVIMSYDIVRNDIEWLSNVDWNYCILDEGHIIKNGKTKLTKAVKNLRAIHRLILSGTPIQNNVLELWSLFDFLMPGFLGSEKAFNDRFGKPIAASRDAKSSSKEQEAGALALEALHKQVLPFLLRRLKEDVLDDLPPKIIQDYYCELSPLQKQLYDAFSGSQAKVEAEGQVSSGAASDGKGQHIFQALQYLRKLVNHPVLVLKDEIPQHRLVLDKANANGGSIRDVAHAPKLEALRQILLDCGIGTSTESESPIDAVSQHRVLIFCQLKQMLDIVENDLFKALMPCVTYMRMDGSTDVTKRHAVVQTFNSDPSIDCLLLTTHVGGLGLNLTGADTVIFVEHDWNPMKDLQAMDRAHRLGQKKVVNVYRLIMRGTLEEKIMGLQRFKLNIASSVVTQQNSDLTSLGTDQILDLFQVSASGPVAPASSHTGKDHATGQSAILAGLGELPAEDEYQDLDLTSFLA